MKGQNIKRVSDIINEGRYNVEVYYDIESVLDKEIVIYDFKQVKGNYGDYFIVLASEDGKNEKFVFTTGSQVVKKKLLMCKEAGALPVKAKIIRVKRYFDIV